MFIHLDMSSGQKGKGDKTGIAVSELQERDQKLKVKKVVEKCIIVLPSQSQLKHLKDLT